MNSYEYTGGHDSKCVIGWERVNMLLLSEWTMEVNMGYSKIKIDYGICWLSAPIFFFIVRAQEGMFSQRLVSQNIMIYKHINWFK